MDTEKIMYQMRGVQTICVGFISEPGICRIVTEGGFTRIM